LGSDILRRALVLQEWKFPYGNITYLGFLLQKRGSGRNIILKRAIRIDDDRSQRLLIKNLVAHLNGLKVLSRKLLLGKAFGFLGLLS